MGTSETPGRSPGTPDRSVERDERTGRAAAAQRMQQKDQWVDLQIQEAMNAATSTTCPVPASRSKVSGPPTTPTGGSRSSSSGRRSAPPARPPAAQGRRRARSEARPAHRRVRGTPRARGVQRAGDEGALHACRRPAPGDDAPRRRGRRGRLARTPTRAPPGVGRPPGRGADPEADSPSSPMVQAPLRLNAACASSRAPDGQAGFSHTDTCCSLSAVNGVRSQSAHRSFSRRPAIRAIRSSSAGHTYRNGIEPRR